MRLTIEDAKAVCITDEDTTELLPMVLVIKGDYYISPTHDPLEMAPLPASKLKQAIESAIERGATEVEVKDEA